MHHAFNQVCYIGSNVVQFLNEWPHHVIWDTFQHPVIVNLIFKLGTESLYILNVFCALSIVIIVIFNE